MENISDESIGAEFFKTGDVQVAQQILISG